MSNVHIVHGSSDEGLLVVIADIEHNGEYEYPLADEFVLRFDEDNEPCMSEGDTFRAGYTKTGDRMIFVVKHANGDSASFLTQRDMYQYLSDRYDDFFRG